MDVACFHQVFLAANDHFQLAFGDISDLFVDVVVFGGGMSFFDIPEDEGAAVAVNHFSEKARKCLFYSDIAEILHYVDFSKDTPTGG